MVDETYQDDGLLRVTVTDHEEALEITFNFSDRPRSDATDLSGRFQRLSESWTKTCISFFDMVPFLAGFGFVFAKKSVSSVVVKYLEDHSIASEKRTNKDGKCEQSFVVHEDDARIVLKEHGKSLMALEAARTIQKSTLGSLVSEYEHLIDQLFRLLADIKPELFLSESASVSAAQVLKTSNLDELKDSLVNDAIDKVLGHKSHMEVIDWIRKNLSIPANLGQPLEREFTEICQRRHILIHNGGIVNSKYRDVCLEAGFPENGLADVLEMVEVDEFYLRSATARVFQVGFNLLHMMWQKYLPNERRSSFGAILESSHEFLDAGLTKMCRKVIKFARHEEKKFENRLRMYFTINESLSFLHEKEKPADEQLANALAVLDDGDWSVTTPTVDLALACVRRDFDLAISLAPHAFEDGVTYQFARTWAVFKEVRNERPEFLEHFPRGALLIEAVSVS